MKKINSFYLILTSIAISSCCGTRMATCPDGRPVSFPKSENCASKIYKDAVKDFSAKLKATVNIVDEVTVGVDNLDIKSESKLLKEKLDQRSIRLQETLKSSYLGLVRDPCGYSANHAKLVESVNTFNYELDSLKTNLENQLKANQLATKEKDIANILNDYLYQRGKREGNAIGQIARLLDEYYKVNQQYPESLDKIQASELVSLLGSSRLDYKLINSNEYKLIFAGEDYALGTSDDKLTIGINGKIER